MVGLFGFITPVRGYANQFGRCILYRHGHRIRCPASGHRRHRLAQQRLWLGIGRRIGAGAGGTGVLCLGYRGQAGRHSDIRYGVLCGASVVYACFGVGRDRRPVLGSGDRSRFSNQRRGHRRASQHETLTG